MPPTDPAAAVMLLRSVVSALVDRPEDVEIRAVDTRSLEVLVNEADMPLVLGRNGQTVRALRSVVSLMPPDRRADMRISVQPK